ncbi:hypothetical protein [Xanthobacter sp. ZOL 2024]
MRDPRTMTVAERKAEEQRQVQALAEAIQTAIQQVAAGFDPPMLNAIAGALVTVEARMLAACDAAGRKALRKAMEASRPGALAEALTRAKTCRVATVEVRRNDA